MMPPVRFVFLSLSLSLSPFCRRPRKTFDSHLIFSSLSLLPYRCYLKQPQRLQSLPVGNAERAQRRLAKKSAHMPARSDVTAAKHHAGKRVGGINNNQQQTQRVVSTNTTTTTKKAKKKAERKKRRRKRRTRRVVVRKNITGTRRPNRSPGKGRDEGNTKSRRRRFSRYSLLAKAPNKAYRKKHRDFDLTREKAITKTLNTNRILKR